MKNRINEILSGITSFGKEGYTKSELLPELLALQTELVNLTFNEEHADRGHLRLWDVEGYLTKLNAERGGVANEQLYAFKSDCREICNLIRGEFAGQKGENKAYWSLDTLRGSHRVLRNVELFRDGHRAELDMVVLTEKAVFILEVKNTAKDIQIDEQGNYCRISHGNLITDKNIGEKMNEKEYLLREALSDYGIENPNIISLVVFTNSMIRVRNNYPHISICFVNELARKVDTYMGDVIYSKQDMNHMSEAIESARCSEAYSLSIDMDAFKLKFATLMALLEHAKESPVSETTIIAEPVASKAETTHEDGKPKDDEYKQALAWMQKRRGIANIVAAALVAAASAGIAIAAVSRPKT